MEESLESWRYALERRGVKVMCVNKNNKMVHKRDEEKSVGKDDVCQG